MSKKVAPVCRFGFTGAYRFQGGTVHLARRFHGTFISGFAQSDPSR